MADAASPPTVSAVVVTYDAMPWIEQCLESVRGIPAVVVDNGSSDGTVELVRERFPEVTLVEQGNLGLAAGWNRGIELAGGDLVLVINADAWLVGDALAAMTRVAERRPDAALVGPRLRNPDGTLQRSVRGFPTVWRLATEYLFLRKLAPGSRLLNAFYGAGFDHERELDAEFLMGACMLIRRTTFERIGPFDEDFFLFSEETDWCYRARLAGWKVVFTPEAECVHVGGASHGGRLFRENVRGHLRFMAKHHGPRGAERTRQLLRLALVLRAALYRGERGAQYREVARWLGSGDVPTLLGR